MIVFRENERKTEILNQRMEWVVSDLGISLVSLDIDIFFNIQAQLITVKEEA